MTFGRLVVVVVTVLIGINALLGGFAAISKPDGPFGIPISVLKNGIFKSFLIPGLVLFVVIGIGNLAAAVSVLKKSNLHEYVIGIAGAISMGWIAIQVYVMMEINFMHVAVFGVAVVQAGYSIYSLIKGDKFPFNLV